MDAIAFFRKLTSSVGVNPGNNMKKTQSLQVALFACAITFVSAPSGRAAEVVSNLGETPDSTPFFTQSTWRGTSFTTDSLGYTLNSVSLSLRLVEIPENAIPKIFADGSGIPSGAALETFSAQLVNADTTYTFTSAGLSLSPNTTYWLTVQSGSTEGVAWWSTASANQTGGWTIGNSMKTSFNNGSTWPTTEAFTGQFSVSATPVPEPKNLLPFAGFLMGGYALWRRRSRPSSKPSRI